MKVFTCPEGSSELAKSDTLIAAIEEQNLVEAPASGRLPWIKRYRRGFKALLADPQGFLGLFTQQRTGCTPKVAVVANGGIGDLLRVNALLAEFRNRYPDACFHIFTGGKGRAQLAFAGLKGVDRIASEYLLYWFENRYDLIYEAEWGMMKTRSKSTAPADLVENEKRSRHLFAVREEYVGASACNRMGREAVAQGVDYMQALALSAGLGKVDSLMPLFDLAGTENVMSGQRYVSLHHGWDVKNRSRKTHVKCWPLEHWEKFVRLFKQRFPEIKVVQLGAQTATEIAGVDVCLVNKTTFQQACALLAGSVLHVDADSGFSHISRVFGTKTIVMFGPTHCEFIAYRENINIKSSVCGNCAFVTPEWDSSCPRGFSKPICMHSITPEFVMKMAERHLTSRTDGT